MARRQRVLITGGAGYIGAHTAVHLMERKFEVSVLDDLSTGTRDALQRAQRIAAKNLEFYQTDLRDAEATMNAVRAAQPDVVIHLAGSKSVAQSMRSPEEFEKNNVQTTANLVTAMGACGVRQVIFASTASVYGEPGSGEPVCEKDAIAPESPYAHTKVASEALLNAFGRDHRASVIHLRFFNVCGAHASGLLGEATSPATNLMPILMQRSQSNAPEVTVFGTDWPTPDGSCIRDYVHVEDVVLGIRLAMAYAPRIVGHEVFNLGTEHGSSVFEVIAAVESATSRTIRAIPGPRRAGDPGRYIANCALARQRLGWQPQWTLADMARHAWLWQQQQPSES